MEYRVIATFTDLNDKSYLYKAGDTYPRKGVVPTAERIKSLSSKNNKRGIQLIEKVGKKPADQKPKDTPKKRKE